LGDFDQNATDPSVDHSRPVALRNSVKPWSVAAPGFENLLEYVRKKPEEVQK
jgi:hypothetical protein